ncbi:MFS transporter [Deinococcus multiflagellatus]|uniref:MFS transporter n=1 Tax=Deinococcus multiflagellatus TaxID=1656887 RepID=A0ABW1ZFV6_9DEIO|nr:MFS transporter [Deinococcus multiflagellatus]MBZ9711796.1 MFS transporter [Deinococcus multiflagellatus]
MTSTPARAPVSPWVLSAFWFGTAFHWLALLLILMPANVLEFVGEARKGSYVGLLTVIGAVMALVIPPLVGAHSDRTGRRLPYLKLGVGVNLAGLGVMGLAVALLDGMPGFWVYVLGFLLVQFGNNYATAPYSALIPQLVPVSQRGRYSGAMGMLQAAGQLLGALSAFALGQLQLPSITLFVLTAVMLLVPALVTMRGVPDDPVSATPQAAQPAAHWTTLFAHRPFLWVFITRALFALGQYSVQPFLQYYNGDVLGQKDPVTSNSIMLACIIVASIVSALIGGRLSDRVGRKPVIYVAGTTMAGAALLLLVVPSFALALPLAALFGLGFGAFTSVDWALGSDAMPSERSFARDMGIWHVAFVAPQFIGGPQGVLLDWGNARAENLGYTLVFGLAAAFFMLGVVLVRNVPERLHGEGARQAA